ncbi:MAG TPA: hypothetical protein VKU36_03690 [Candidatus Babeliales bacterium]|nr:hypothetical protein [Candidatus Babeliales bacterium]
MKFKKIFVVLVFISVASNISCMKNNNDKIVALDDYKTNSKHINKIIKKNPYTLIFVRDHPYSYYSREGFGTLYLGNIRNIINGKGQGIKNENGERSFGGIHTYDYYGEPYEVQHTNCLKKIHTSIVNNKYVACTLSKGEEAIVILNPHHKWGYPEANRDLCDELEEMYRSECNKDPKKQ